MRIIVLSLIILGFGCSPKRKVNFKDYLQKVEKSSLFERYKYISLYNRPNAKNIYYLEFNNKALMTYERDNDKIYVKQTNLKNDSTQYYITLAGQIHGLMNKLYISSFISNANYFSMEFDINELDTLSLPKYNCERECTKGILVYKYENKDEMLFNKLLKIKRPILINSNWYFYKD